MVRRSVTPYSPKTASSLRFQLTRERRGVKRCLSKLHQQPGTGKAPHLLYLSNQPWSIRFPTLSRSNKKVASGGTSKIPLADESQTLGSKSMSMNNSISISSSPLIWNDLDASSPRSFLDAGFDLENYNVNNQGYAVKAFEWAARQPTRDCLDLLLRKSGMIDVTESLYWAVRENVFSAVQAIVEATKIDINRQTHHGLTPLHLACMHGHEEIARYLVRKGAHVNPRDTGGMTSLLFHGIIGGTRCT